MPLGLSGISIKPKFPSKWLSSVKGLSPGKNQIFNKDESVDSTNLIKGQLISEFFNKKTSKI
jgi:hypothetical protein